MLYTIGGVALLTIVMWLIPTQHTLAMLDENINNAMGQIGGQLSSRWNALSALLDLTKSYAVHEYQTISEIMKLRRSITFESSPQEAASQDNMLIRAMGHIVAIAEQYPTFKADKHYRKTMDRINQYEGMMHQSRLTYNDNVTKLNRRIRIFPTSAIAGLLGFSKRDYMESHEVNAKIPGMEQQQLL